MVLGRIFGGLFGGGKDDPGGGATHASVDYKGFTITPAPVARDGQWQIAGTISKPDDDGNPREHRLIRADVMPGEDMAVEFCIRKAKQVIDEQGERLFG